MLLNMECELELLSWTCEDSSTFVHGKRRLQQWDTSGSRIVQVSSGDNRDDCDEGVDASKGDYPRWMDTSATLSDCWTKTMTSCRLIETLSAGIFDMRPTEESPAIKAENRTWRASKKEQERLQDLDD